MALGKNILASCVSNLSGLRVFFLLFLTTAFGSSQIVVKSLAELQPYLDDDNVSVKLAPGEYIVTADDVRDGVYGKISQEEGFDDMISLV